MSDSYRRKFRLFTFRKPERWETIKRAALVTGAVGALAVGARKNRALAGMALDRAQRLTRNRNILWRLPIESISQANRHVKSLRKLTAMISEQKQLRRAFGKRGNRLANAAKITAGAGVGYVGMPYARKRGVKNNLEWQRQHWR